MENKDKFKEGAKSYRKGFLLGAFLGIVICLWLQKTVLSLPILLGLVGGSIALNLKVK